jgi:putative nucleotidyltransferase with HDIG domain
MSENAARLRLHEDIVQALGTATRAVRLYGGAHPKVAEHVNGLVESIRQLHAAQAFILIGFVGGEVIADDTPLRRVSRSHADLTREMEDAGIQRIVIDRGVTPEEVATLIRALAAGRQAGVAGTGEAADEATEFLALPHLRAGRIVLDPFSGGWASGTIPARRTYQSSVASARTLWESAHADGQPELPVARETVLQLADAVGAGESLMLGLTGMKEHDDYTFTHMVNVSILTMAQAQRLGIEGPPLQDIGLAALLHDIGKVRTPPEILNKPSALTDREFAIMKRHTTDGALILRRTPDMPALAPIVALEHHLRLDGSGYPDHVRRSSLNLVTMLCSIADVYDAMRSQRQYQQAFPTDRIVAVMRRNDGTQFDQRLVRRFIELLGIYPPGTLVRLDSGEIALVLRPESRDPERPAVRLIFDRAGNRMPHPEDVSLSQRISPEGGPSAIAGVLDPATFQIDPLAVLAA